MSIFKDDWVKREGNPAAAAGRNREVLSAKLLLPDFPDYFAG